MASIVVTRPLAALLAALAVAVLVVGGHLVLKSEPAPDDPAARRRNGLKALVMGSDGRASTSKVQVVLWTFAVLYAFAFLLLWGRSAGCDGNQQDTGQCQEAREARASFDEVTGRGIQEEYYVLLGLPLAAALASKAITSAKVADRDVVKQEIGAEHKGFTRGLAEVVADDDGETDLVDFQYFAFNLLTLAFFFTEFLNHPGNGLPDLPPTLIALSGVSTAGYATKKVLERAPSPKVTSVQPERLARVAGTTVAVIGSCFGAEPGADGGVRLGGVPLALMGWSDGRIDARLTEVPLPGKASLVVTNANQQHSNAVEVEVVDPPPVERAASAKKAPVKKGP